MDLWIRSQDKQELIKANGINVYQYDESAGLGNDWHIFVRDYEVGVYKSKERALEIIDEIQNYIVNIGKTYIKTNENGIPDSLFHYDNLYEMPKE